MPNKAKFEVAMQVVERWALAKLRRQGQCSVAELRADFEWGPKHSYDSCQSI
jgi:hypothetical protein